MLVSESDYKDRTEKITLIMTLRKWILRMGGGWNWLRIVSNGWL
jgi:hypothetical protein